MEKKCWSANNFRSVAAEILLHNCNLKTAHVCALLKLLLNKKICSAVKLVLNICLINIDKVNILTHCQYSSLIEIINNLKRLQSI